ncbi:MAG: toll/interleukin-1 receptor domain-containing protein [Magnetococcales bacterium]|nr:TIR domain-containing protein [Magnetococcales bacterium]NGZ28886.1 toll/interleukin-1 receptor domain-containing protein [Magnetococcales bacterium]
MSRPVRLFISYASKDRHWLDKLLIALHPLQRAGLVEPWHDRNIGAGEIWHEEILDHMNKADVVLLLLSQDFIASNYIHDTELPVFFRRREDGLKIFPVLLDHCHYRPLDYLCKLQFLNENDSPLVAYTPRTRAFTMIARRLDAEVQRIIPTLQPEAPKPPPVIEEFSLNKLLIALPDTGTQLFGREKELRLLDAWDFGVMVWVAGGGTGKSALTRYWLVNRTWPEGTRFIGHSFYSQGTREQASSSAPFIKQILQSFGVKDNSPGDYERGQLLAQKMREKNTVLVLDGVEPLQHSPQGKLGGLFKDQGLAGLLTELAREPGECRCLVSSRVHLADTSLRMKNGRFIQQHDLNHLSPTASVELLCSRGANGRHQDLENTATHYGYHALALVLIAEYLHTFHAGRVEKALEIPLIAQETKAGRHAMSVMKAYDLALQKAGEDLDREMVRLLGLFDRPAETAAMEALKNATPISGLTTLYCQATLMEVEESLARLRQWGLLNPGPDLDAHPLVREWFAEALQTDSPKAFRKAHALLFRHYQQIPAKEYPGTLDEMEPLYRAVRHGCLAGEYEEARAKVFWGRILRGNQFYSMKILGAYSSDLSVISSFFPNGFEQMPVNRLSETGRNWLVAVASFLLMSLGRLTEAVGLQRVDIQLTEKANDWKEAATSTQNLIDLLLPLGRLEEAWEAACHAIGFVDRIAESWDYESNQRLIQGMFCLAYQGRVAHMQGRIVDAITAFGQAEFLQKKRQPSLPRLFSVPGTTYALFLLECAVTPSMRVEVLDRGRYIKRLYEDRPMETAFGHLITGLALASLVRTSEAVAHLHNALVEIRRAGINLFLPMVLLSYTQVLHRYGDLLQAKKHLAEALEIAERGKMRLYLADGYLLAGEIALDEGQEAKEEYLKAEQLINDMGYERRRGELLLLKARIENCPELLKQAFDQFRGLEQLGLLEWYKNKLV